uniref:Programmed cell death protein 10 dimerisation domain-containing protein n=1 Tax=Micrurus spixii TaxID=129469 RepID=A0A2D4MVE1_9SAUR
MVRTPAQMTLTLMEMQMRGIKDPFGLSLQLFGPVPSTNCIKGCLIMDLKRLVNPSRGNPGPNVSLLSSVLSLENSKTSTSRLEGNVGAMEELENAFSLAEESCPGISDKLIAYMMERVQR